MHGLSDVAVHMPANRALTVTALRARRLTPRSLGGPLTRMRTTFIGLVVVLFVAGLPGAACADPMCHSTSCAMYISALWTATLALPFWFLAGIVAAALSRSLRMLRPHLLALPFAMMGAAIFIGGLDVTDRLPLSLRFSPWVLVILGLIAGVPTVAWYLGTARRVRAAAQLCVEPDGGLRARRLTP